jgi:hypothetical protein
MRSLVPLALPTARRVEKLHARSQICLITYEILYRSDINNFSCWRGTVWWRYDTELKSGSKQTMEGCEAVRSRSFPRTSLAQLTHAVNEAPRVPLSGRLYIWLHNWVQGHNWAPWLQWGAKGLSALGAELNPSASFPFRNSKLRCNKITHNGSATWNRNLSCWQQFHSNGSGSDGQLAEKATFREAPQMALVFKKKTYFYLSQVWYLYRYIKTCAYSIATLYPNFKAICEEFSEI